ncbi:MAG: hypothetical protein GY938_24500 [Ketobacter sp.]|nr:hypothetical protein [Ketobacter sp.]
MKWAVEVRKSDYKRNDQLHVACFEGDQMSEITSITMTTRDTFKASENPPFFEGPEVIAIMQAFMDEAYAIGLRPSAAQDDRHKSEHLKDMREITRHLLKMDKK